MMPGKPETGGELLAELLLGKLAEARAGVVVRAHRLIAGVPRVGGHFLGHLAQLVDDRLLVPVLAEQRLDPRLGAVVLPSSRPTRM
jgi:hypothetical protein